MNDILIIAGVIALIAFAIGWVVLIMRLAALTRRVETSLDQADALMAKTNTVVGDIEPSVKKWGATSERIHDDFVEPIVDTAISLTKLLPGGSHRKSGKK